MHRKAIIDRDWSHKMMIEVVLSMMVKEKIIPPVNLIKDELNLDEWDKSGGIDYVLKEISNGNLITLATRVQDADINLFKSFTIRAERHTGVKTEYQKRIEALEGDYLMAKKVVQAYVSKKTKKLKYLCMMNQADLIESIKTGIKGFDYIEIPNPENGNIFYAVFCKRLINRDYLVNEYPRRQNQMKLF